MYPGQMKMNKQWSTTLCIENSRLSNTNRTKNRCEFRCSVRVGRSWSTSGYIEICHCLLYFWYSPYECPFPVCAMQHNIRTRRYSVPPCFDNATLLEFIRQLWSDLNEQRLVRNMFQHNKTCRWCNSYRARPPVQ